MFIEQAPQRKPVLVKYRDIEPGRVFRYVGTSPRNSRSLRLKLNNADCVDLTNPDGIHVYEYDSGRDFVDEACFEVVNATLTIHE